jgi:3-hydroxyisobutyrate dehydrogenase-like beta-hydroxyacid dehydrogenase
MFLEEQSFRISTLQFTVLTGTSNPHRRMCMRIGFIGLGNMGQAMARRLVENGHELVVWNRSHEKAQQFAEQTGTSAAEHPADAARAEAVITMLSDDAAVEAVVFGLEGILTTSQPGTIHISMSTISPALSQRLAAAHEERGEKYVAAPVLGRPEAAAEGKLFIIAAGQNDTLRKLEPLFSVLGQRTFHVSEQSEQANLVKLSANFLITCVIESLGEVFAVARKSNLDPGKVLEVLTSTLFSAPVYKTYGARVLEQQFSPAGFRMPLGLKDVRLMLQVAENASSPMPFANVIRDHFLSGLAKGFGELDWSAIALVIAEEAGLEAERPKAAD